MPLDQPFFGGVKPFQVVCYGHHLVMNIGQAACLLHLSQRTVK
jgi:hypothetical protein